LAALRLDGALPEKDAKNPDAQEVRKSLGKALSEIRAISRGLALPDLDALDLRTLVTRAVDDHEHQTDMEIALSFVGKEPFSIDYTQKICVYRFLQETLSNVARHAAVDQASVKVEAGLDAITVSVRDHGTGFDAETSLRVRSDGGQGLLGLLDRAHSIGGNLTITSKQGKGTTMRLTLANVENTT